MRISFSVVQIKQKSEVLVGAKKFRVEVQFIWVKFGYFFGRVIKKIVGREKYETFKGNLMEKQEFAKLNNVFKFDLFSWINVWLEDIHKQFKLCFKSKLREKIPGIYDFQNFYLQALSSHLQIGSQN